MNKTDSPKADPTEQIENSVNNGDSGNVSNDDNSSNTSYATELVLNSARQITIAVGSCVKLKSGFIMVSPSSLINYISTTTSVRGSGVNNGITFEDNTIYANSVGNYSLKFSIPASSTANLSETMLINVVNTNSHISQNINTLTINETNSIADIFTTYSSGYEINYSSSAFEISNDKITAKILGEQSIRVEFSRDYFIYCYNFSFTVKDVPEYVINITNYNTDTITKSLSVNSFSIFYEITNRDEEHVSQDINVDVGDESIIYVGSGDVLDSRIKVHCLSAGSTTLTISYVLDPSISKTITIVIN